MLETAPNTIPLNFESHGIDLLHFFETCRNRGIGTDVELRIDSKVLSARVSTIK